MALDPFDHLQTQLELRLRGYPETKLGAKANLLDS
jgi:hypothetical protein